ncbi:hypothetical protein NQ317_003366 [Molorchus minor]|uniref:peptidylprolyl isomerase n=1 Tax=Molorchus minor TaxID=1323400 RepID=A0ABQ9K7R9_9CUCU|nr:hypothetical protein NQ317_003366 [Molorchus minor]
MNKGAVSNVVLDTLRNTLMLNLAAVKLKRNKYKQALELCNEIIKKDRMSGKAYYRRAQARLGLKDYDKAIDDLNTAVSNIPNDKNVLDLLNKTKKLKLAYLKREKKDVFQNVSMK